MRDLDFAFGGADASIMRQVSVPGRLVGFKPKLQNIEEKLRSVMD